MASEKRRGCGYRKVGGMYLCGSYTSLPCDRLPFPLDTCPVCGSGIKVGRAFTSITPLHLFQLHQDCLDVSRPCFICDPAEAIAYIMKVGEQHYPTPADFMREGVEQGISKRISAVPRDFELGKTIIYLAHPRACESRTPAAVQEAMDIIEEGTADARGSVLSSEPTAAGIALRGQPKLLEAEKVEKTLGIFTAFIPQRIEKLYWKSELDAMSPEDLEKLNKRGITPVGIPDGDKDHKGN